MAVELSYRLQFCNTYHDGMFYVYDRDTRVTEVVDPATGAVVQSIPPQVYAATEPVDSEWGFDLFVESCGDLLGISIIYKKHVKVLDYTPENFEIHRLDDRNGSTRWIQMKSIGDRFLLMDGSTGVSYNASDFPGLERNSIYFLCSALHGMNFIISSSYLVVFDIEKGIIRRLQCPDDVQTWFLPGLH